MKTRANIRIEKTLWDSFGAKYPNKRSKIIEEFIGYMVNKDSDEESRLQHQLEENEKDKEYLKYQLKKVQDEKKRRTEDNLVMNKLLDDIEYIAIKRGSVGKNKIKNLAQHNKVKYSSLLTTCVEKGIPIEEFQMDYEEGNIRNGRL